MSGSSDLYGGVGCSQQGSNMAVQKEPGRKNKPAGEGESLASKQLHKLGDRAVKQKPAALAQKAKSKEKPKSSNVMDPTRKTKIVISFDLGCGQQS
jgi:hypothetical protein